MNRTFTFHTGILLVALCAFAFQAHAQAPDLEKRLAEGTKITEEDVRLYYLHKVLNVAQTDFLAAYKTAAVYKEAGEKIGAFRGYGMPKEHLAYMEAAASDLLANATFRLGKEPFDQEDVFYDLFDVMRCQNLRAGAAAKILFQAEMGKENPAAKAVVDAIRASRASKK